MVNDGMSALQDLLHRPFYHRCLTKNSPLAAKVDADAWWQMRICDVVQYLAKMHLAGAELSFNLKLEDPIEAFLEADSPWRGVGGDYRVSLGPQSMAEIGSDPALPTLRHP